MRQNENKLKRAEQRKKEKWLEKWPEQHKKVKEERQRQNYKNMPQTWKTPNDVACMEDFDGMDEETMPTEDMDEERGMNFKL